MASTNQRKPRKHIFAEEDIQAMANAGCKAAVEAMRDGRAPSGKDINRLSPGRASRIRKIIQSDGVEQREPAGV